MKLSTLAATLLLPCTVAVGGPAWAATTYLNNSNITVAVGPGTSPGTFNNTFAVGATISKVIDAPTAAAEEFHDQATHIWYTAAQTGGGLELLFDFGTEYDLSVLHFWNYTGEGFDVDDLAFKLYNNVHSLVGTLSVAPALGSNPGIKAQDLVLAAPLNVRYVTAFLTGSNRQVDFQNIGFTASVSAPIPEPGALGLVGAGAMVLLMAGPLRRRRDGASASHH